MKDHPTVFRLTIRTVTFCLFFASIFAAQGQNIYSNDTWKERDRWQNVPAILEAMGLKSGQTIADIGSHQGYMTFKFAKAIGREGKVFAVDVSNSQLETLNRLLKEQEVGNVETILGDYDDPKLPKNSLDFAFIMDAYHEMDDYKDILRHIKSALKTDGKLVILEPIGDDRRGMKRREQERRHEIDMSYVIEDLEEAGFKITRQKDPFIDRTKKKKDKLWLLIAEVNN